MASKEDLKRRLFNKVIKTDDCWLWTGSKNRWGYGNISVRENGKEKVYAVHRLVLQLEEIIIPENMVVDHLCRVRNCVNPKHLEIVTQRENILRSLQFRPKHINNYNSRKTMCKYGHLYTEDNIYICPKGKRECKICRKDAVTKYRLSRVSI